MTIGVGPEVGVGVSVGSGKGVTIGIGKGIDLFVEADMEPSPPPQATRIRSMRRDMTGIICVICIHP